MKYIIWVLLSVAFATLLRPTPVHINKQTHGTVSAHVATVTVKVTPETPKSQPETTEAVVTTQPAESYANGCSTYDSLFRQYAWDARVAEAICVAESGGNPYAVSNPRLNYDGVSDYGLMQIHGEEILNPSANIARAHQKYVIQGWHAWSTYTSGAYLRFL